jgi:hypothetical protein
LNYTGAPCNGARKARNDKPLPDTAKRRGPRQRKACRSAIAAASSTAGAARGAAPAHLVDVVTAARLSTLIWLPGLTGPGALTASLTRTTITLSAKSTLTVPVGLVAESALAVPVILVAESTFATSVGLAALAALAALTALTALAWDVAAAAGVSAALSSTGLAITVVHCMPRFHGFSASCASDGMSVHLR